MKSSIKVKWQFAGFHCYPDAPENVSFLKDKHRHLFKCTAKIEVFHDDRELEFFTVQEQLSGLFNGVSSSGMSCEMIARNICTYISHEYFGRDIEVEVSEDGENSSIVEYKK